MSGCLQLILITGGFVILIVVIIVQYVRLRTITKERSLSVMQTIREQTRLARELERALIEKEAFKEIINEQLQNNK